MWDRIHVMQRVCEELSCSSKGVAQILKEIDGPSYSTVKLWQSDDEELSAKYVRAKLAQAEYLAQQIIDIADEEPMMSESEGGARVDSGFETWRKTRIDARKWTASKLLPHKYGDKIAHTGENGGTIDMSLSITFVSPKQ